MVACVVGSESKRLGLDLCDLAKDPGESAAQELCARCGFTFLGPIDGKNQFETLPE